MSDLETVEIRLPLTVYGLGLTISDEGDESLWLETKDPVRSLLTLADLMTEEARRRMALRDKDLERLARLCGTENSPESSPASSQDPNTSSEPS
jgi:hypothetical protein